MFLDTNGDGYLSLSQLSSLGPIDHSIFSSIDTDNSGFIDYSEFLAASLPRALYLREDYLRTAFDMFDSDGSGKIDMVELGNLLQGDDSQYKCTKKELGEYI